MNTTFRSQAEAATECASMGAQIASIETVDELQLIQRLLRDTCEVILYVEPLLLTCINFNPSMDK